jgi:hypothetical protein
MVLLVCRCHEHLLCRLYVLCFHTCAILPAQKGLTIIRTHTGDIADDRFFRKANDSDATQFSILFPFLPGHGMLLFLPFLLSHLSFLIDNGYIIVL